MVKFHNITVFDQINATLVSKSLCSKTCKRSYQPQTSIISVHICCIYSSVCGKWKLVCSGSNPRCPGILCATVRTVLVSPVCLNLSGQESAGRLCWVRQKCMHHCSSQRSVFERCSQICVVTVSTHTAGLRHTSTLLREANRTKLISKMVNVSNMKFYNQRNWKLS